MLHPQDSVPYHSVPAADGHPSLFGILRMAKFNLPAPRRRFPPQCRHGLDFAL